LNNIQLNASASVNGTLVYNPAKGNILGVGAHTLEVDFTPADTANYSNVSKSVSINVLQATPEINWSNPDDVVYGTALNYTQLNAEATVNGTSIPGNFNYNPEIGTVLGAGNQTLHVDFAPEDSVNYNNALKNVSINVTKVTPEITWNKPEDIVYETALSSTQLNASSVVKGQLTYTPDVGTVLGVGQHTLNVDLRPEDTANYTTASRNVSINVTKATPEITWNKPEDIVYRTALNDTQLNAEASVNGTFVYNPAEGTIIGIGEQILNVNFTPEDTANYTNASKSVSINVLNTSYSIFKSVIAPDETGDCIVNSAGDKIPYRIVVKNEGDENLTNVTVNDSIIILTGPVGNDIDPEVLNPGETWIYTGIYKLTSDDINNESNNISNTATVSCNELPEKSSSVDTPIAKKTDLSIYKSVIGIDEAGDYMINEPGDVINYQVAVRNNGNVKLTGISVNDPMVKLTGPTGDHNKPGILDPGETWVYTGNYTVTQMDIDSNGNNYGFIENTATVSCKELSNESSSKKLPIIRILPVVVTPKSNDSNALPTVDFNTNTTSGNAPLSVQFTDFSQNAALRSWDFNNDGTADSIEVSSVYTYTAPGTYTANLTVSNANGNVSKNATITVLQATSSSSSSGRSSSSGSSNSGGTGGSSEPAYNIEVKEISQAFITSGSSVKFDFPKNATAVVYLSFDSKKTAGKTATIVENLRGKSTFVSELPSDEVYKSLNIWVGNSGFATPNNIENAVVCFKVEKTWIQDKKIDKSSITLNRYSDKKWEQLLTSLLKEDDKYLYFTAKTPGFSPFSITGKSTTGTEIQSATSTQSPEQENENTAENAEQTADQRNNTSTLGKGSKRTPGFGILCGITGLLAVFMYRRKTN
jgi:PGF-pre-PGF domain-containing protein